MLRSLGWILGGVFVLVLVAVLTLAGDGDFSGLLREKMLQHSSSGLGFADGELVVQRLEMPRFTVEQLASLDGRLQGISYSSDPLLARMSWYGVSLRDAFRLAADLPDSQVIGDPGLDEIWLDVDASRTKGFFESSANGWEECKALLLPALAQAYGLQPEREQRLLQQRVLRAGPGLAPHRSGRRGGGSTVRQQPGVLGLENAPISHALEFVRERVGYDVTEGIDADERFSFSLQWDPDDEASLVPALAEQLDLHLESVERSCPVLVLSGVPRPPEHRR